MPPSSDPAVPTVTPVTISYSELQDRDKDLSVKIEEGFGPNGLGILSITQVPGYSSLRGNLLGLSPRLANLPEEVKKELEDPHSRYNFGWSHGKEKLESGKPVVEYAIHVSGLTATYKLRGHNNGLWYWPIGPRSVPDHYEGTIARETIVNVVNYNCGEIQQQPRFEAQLRSLLPQITSAFGANKSVLVTIDELKKQQQSSDATANWCDEN